MRLRNGRRGKSITYGIGLPVWPEPPNRHWSLIASCQDSRATPPPPGKLEEEAVINLACLYVVNFSSLFP